MAACGSSVVAPAGPGPLAFFGEPWGAPMLEGAVRVEVPVGDVCSWCAEVFVLGDRGVLRGGWAAHRECDVRAVVGGVNHLARACSCAGGSEPPDPPGLSVREAALAAFEYLAGGELRGPLRVVLDRLGELGVPDVIAMPGFERYLLICCRQAHVFVMLRPSYCDRGRFLVKVAPKPGSLLALSFDGEDGFPRYYFDPQACATEVAAWMRVRRLLECAQCGGQLEPAGSAVVCGSCGFSRLR